ncbi:hypothetical protein BIW11_02842 [Tropilaelaps mercedesae]|uniref:Uncharacterized protein n=1 Tax=Tropilaelaps mercedesae TaxID=418985 RepID=A0A1V9XWJ0_9ACAR|nr:hypothetical protein BIW11_02842 [Tropilaelaps mercedesae]
MADNTLNLNDNVVKKQRRRPMRLQKSRLLEVEANLRLLLSRGLDAKKSDAAILATAPRSRNTVTTQYRKEAQKINPRTARRLSKRMAVLPQEGLPLPPTPSLPTSVPLAPTRTSPLFSPPRRTIFISNH